MDLRSTYLPGLVCALALTTCATAAPAAASEPAAPAHALPADATDDPAAMAECRARPGMHDILVRTTSADLMPETAQLGGAWIWNYGTHTCMDPVTWQISTAPTNPGSCLQVASVDDNPGYDIEAHPAPRLKKELASVCH